MVLGEDGSPWDLLMAQVELTAKKLWIQDKGNTGGAVTSAKGSVPRDLPITQPVDCSGANG